MQDEHYRSRYHLIQSPVEADMGVEAVQKAIDGHNKGDQRRSVSLGRVWFPVLILTISTGFGAGGLLAWNFIANLIAGSPPQP